MSASDTPAGRAALARARSDLRLATRSALWSDAVRATARKLGRKGKADVRRQYAANPDTWWATHHFLSGLSFRNWLRARGFGERDFGIKNLDNVYVRLLEEAAGLWEPQRR